MPDLTQQIVDYVKRRGPSTPIEVAIGTRLNSLVVSAILSDKGIYRHLNRSCMRIGSSHIYFTPEQKSRARVKIFNLLEEDQKRDLKELESKKVILGGEIDEQKLLEYGDFLSGFTLGDQKAWHWFDISGEKALKLLESMVKVSPQVKASPQDKVSPQVKASPQTRPEEQKAPSPARKAPASRVGRVKKKSRKKSGKKSPKKKGKSRKKRTMVSW